MCPPWLPYGSGGTAGHTFPSLNVGAQSTTPPLHAGVMLLLAAALLLLPLRDALHRPTPLSTRIWQ
jgi:hypothetical protein